MIDQKRDLSLLLVFLLACSLATNTNAFHGEKIIIFKKYEIHEYQLIQLFINIHIIFIKKNP